MIKDQRASRNLTVLIVAQALLFISNATVLAVNGVVGKQLALRDGLGSGFATVPVTAWVLGGALTAYPAALVMRRYGRRAGFSTGALCGVLGALLAIMALKVESFWLLVGAAAIVGIYNAFGLQYRFAAADAAPPAGKARAIGFVMSAGMLGGLVGPEVSRHSVDLLTIPYAGIYLILAVFAGLAFLLLQMMEGAPLPSVARAVTSRAVREIAAQPIFIFTVLIAALSHGVMSLLMTATTLTMTSVCGHPYGVAAHVLGAHMVAMFAPSFVTGSLVQRYGEWPVMLAGCLLYALTLIIALDGVSVEHFWWALVLLGIGWNLLYVAASSLLLHAYREGEGAVAQGLNEATVFTSMVIASFLSGYLLDRQGWASLNYFAVGGTALIFAVVISLARHRKANSF